MYWTLNHGDKALTRQRARLVTSPLAFVHRDYTMLFRVTPPKEPLNVIQSAHTYAKAYWWFLLDNFTASRIRSQTCHHCIDENTPYYRRRNKTSPRNYLKATATASIKAKFTSVMIEKQPDAFSRHIYTYEQGMNVVVATLKRFETSHDERERQIFLGMIHNLFNEYRFFLRLPEGISEVLAFFRAS